MRLKFEPERSSATLLRQPLQYDVIRQCGSNSLLLPEALPRKYRGLLSFSRPYLPISLR